MKFLRAFVLAAVAAAMTTTAVQGQSEKSGSPFWGKCLQKAREVPGASAYAPIKADAERCVEEEEKKARARGKK